MEKIPTASDFLWNIVLTMGDTEPYGRIPPDKVNKAMIRFAKLHVEAALKVASEVAQTTHIGSNFVLVDESTILLAYPEENIK